MLVKQLLENVHVDMLLSATTKDNIEPATRKAVGHPRSQWLDNHPFDPYS
jgi:hypothetical protein